MHIHFIHSECKDCISYRLRIIRQVRIGRSITQQWEQDTWATVRNFHRIICFEIGYKKVIMLADRSAVSR